MGFDANQTQHNWLIQNHADIPLDTFSIDGWCRVKGVTTRRIGSTVWGLDMRIVGRMRLRCGNGNLPADTAVKLRVDVNFFSNHTFVRSHSFLCTQ